MTHFLLLFNFTLGSKDHCDLQKIFTKYNIIITCTIKNYKISRTIISFKMYLLFW